MSSNYLTNLSVRCLNEHFLPGKYPGKVYLSKQSLLRWLSNCKISCNFGANRFTLFRHLGRKGLILTVLRWLSLSRFSIAVDL